MAAPHKFEFFFNGMRVGFFEETGFPTKPGRYRYMPYRSGGHYEMHKSRRAGLQPRCTLYIDDRVISFVVVDCPEYGMLELADFRGVDVG